MMIDEIFKAVCEYRKGRKDVALQVAMHPRVYQDCLQEDYNSVMSAFDLRLNKQPETMFGYSLLIDSNFDDDEWRVQNPVILISRNV